MSAKHGLGKKLRSWFDTAKWHIVELENHKEIGSLIGLDSPWTKNARLLDDNNLPDYRLLAVMIENAKRNNYFGLQDELGINSDEYERRQKYFRRFQQSWRRLKNEDRVALITTCHSERNGNPTGTYYIHDGMGRLLAYLYMVEYGGRRFFPVEAFLAEETRCQNESDRSG